MNTSNRNGIARGGCLVAACLAVIAEAGCAARVYSEPVQAYPGPAADPLVYVDTVPVNIEAYPRYSYGSGYAYYVDGRWYQRGPRGWAYYREEPRELQRQRVYAAPAPAPVYPRERPYVQQGPEGPRNRPYVQERPEAPRPDRGVIEEQPRRPEQPRRAPAERR
ncbi:MAG: hypothetical protein M3O46_03380, partial [Myxococcota bacterium]|nr:hypothetical protein [Myxococcota bacterium]